MENYSVEITLTNISTDGLHRSNRNLFRFDDDKRTIYRALRKERGKNPDLTHDYHLFFPLIATVDNPYPELDFHIDMERFSYTLSPRHKELFDLFSAGFTTKQMIAVTGRHFNGVYKDLRNIKALFAAFYKDGYDE